MKPFIILKTDLVNLMVVMVGLKRILTITSAFTFDEVKSVCILLN